MAYNLKKFATEGDYTSAISSLNYPAVSWVESGDTLHYLLEEPQEKFIAKNGNTVLKTVYCDGNPQLTVEEAQSGINRLDLTDVIVSDCVTSLADWIFYNTDGGFTNLSAVTLPNTITQIPSEFVRDCTGLKSFDIPTGCTRIAWEAFLYSGIEELTIPASMLEIEAPALDMPSATSITCLATVPPTITFVSWTQYLPNIPIYVPAASLSAYQAASGWSDLNIQAIPEPPKVTATRTVYNTSKPTSILNSAAISGISKIYIDGVVQPSVVSEYTFSTTGDHTIEYTLADSTKIPYRMFYTIGPKNITIPSSVTLIEDEALNNSPSTSLTVEATVPPSLGLEALYYAKTPPTIYVPSASVSTYQAASGWSTYSANIQAIS